MSDYKGAALIYPILPDAEAAKLTTPGAVLVAAPALLQALSDRHISAEGVAAWDQRPVASCYASACC